MSRRSSTLSTLTSPSPTPRKKRMSLKEIQAEMTPSERRRSINRANSTPKSLHKQPPFKTPSSRSAKDFASPPPSDPAYLKRRARFDKKSHLLGDRGRNSSGSPISPPDLVTPTSSPDGEKNTPSTSVVKRKPLSGKNSVANLLMTPSPSLEFKSTRRPGGATSPSVNQSTSSMVTPPLSCIKTRTATKATPGVKRSPSNATPSRTVRIDVDGCRRSTETPPHTVSKATPSRSVNAYRGSGFKTPPLPLGTPGRRQSLSRTPLVRTPRIQPSPLSVQREKKKLANSSPAGGSETRRNLDKRTARIRHCHYFSAEIHQFRQDKPYLNSGTNHMEDTNVLSRGNNQGIAFCVRKRPIFDYELHRGEFDVVSVDSCTRYDSDRVIMHKTQMHADMRQRIVKHESFACTAAFDEHCTNDNLYHRVGQPLVESVANGSGVATLLMYGQTGSGKTHTMTGMEELAVHDLFDAKDDTARVGLLFVELSGKVCKDLLDPESPNISIAEQKDGSVRFVDSHKRPLYPKPVSSAEELSRGIAIAKARRATQATDVNGVSSRSHAVCQITVTKKNINKGQRGVLTLVDCAGSERRNDSMYHSSERQKESTEINSSLWALKECIRARSKGNSHIPYRTSNLTRILRETFEKQGSRLCIVATVAPNATDTEHSLETLKTVASLVGSQGVELLDESSTPSPTTSWKTSPRRQVQVNQTPVSSKNQSLITPKRWNHQELVEWMDKKHLLPTNKSLQESVDGQVIMGMSRVHLRTLLYDEECDRDKDEKLFLALRTETNRVDKAQRIERSSRRASVG